MTKGIYQYELCQRLSFTRCGGTAEELRAAELLRDEVSAAGGEAEIWPFTVHSYEIRRCSLRQGGPEGSEIACVPIGLGGDFPEGRLLKFYYAERGTDEADYLALTDAANTLVLINEMKPEAYKLLCRHGAAAFAVMNGKVYDSEAESDLYMRLLRPRHLKHGKIPGFTLTARDGMELVRSKTEYIYVESELPECELSSRNVVAFIPGTDKAEEEIVLTAHYDSVPVGTGSWDNASGSAALMALYRHFIKQPARRSLRFIWCGSEEMGLLGSHAWVDAHTSELEQVKFCFNFDMCGTVLGPNLIFVTGKEELESFARQYCREQGYSADVIATVHSSDSAPFADKGVPGIGISRGGFSSAIHCRHDLLPPLSPEGFAATWDFTVSMVGRVANSVILPVDKGMSKTMLEELDKYFRPE